MERFELQIGDVVNYEGIDVKIIGISSVAIDAVDVNNEGYVLSVLDIDPIPLNDSYFEDLGFQRKVLTWVYDTDVFTIIVAKRYIHRGKMLCAVGYNVTMYCKISEHECIGNKVENMKYVHQFRQFIRLCWVGEHPKDGKYLTGNKYKGE